MRVWRVKVWEPREPELGLPGYSARFEFHGEQAPTEAWKCWASAIHYGFQAEASPVQRARERVKA